MSCYREPDSLDESDPDAWPEGYTVDPLPQFECRCAECDERFESPTPDAICDRCAYLNSCDPEDAEG